MPCPFCQSANAPNARACRACGGPLKAAKPPQAAKPLPKVSVPVIAAPVQHAPQLLNSLTLDEKSASIAGIGAPLSESPVLGLFLADGALRWWNYDEDESWQSSNRRLFRQPKPVSCASFAPQHGLMASGHECGQVRWYQFDGRELASPPAHVGRVLALAWTETHLYSGGNDGVIWATALDEVEKSRHNSRVLIEGLGAMTTLAFSPDGALLAVGRDDGAVQGWRLQSGEVPRLDWTRNGHRAPVRSLCFSPNGDMLVSRSADGGVCLWAAQTSYQLPLPPAGCNSSVAPAFARDNRRLALADARGKVEIADVALGQSLCQLPSPEGAIAHLEFASNATLLVAGAREVAVWEIV